MLCKWSLFHLMDMNLLRKDVCFRHYSSFVVQDSLLKMKPVRLTFVKFPSWSSRSPIYTWFTLDFHTNQRISEESASIPTEPLRNKIAAWLVCWYTLQVLVARNLKNLFFTGWSSIWWNVCNTRLAVFQLSFKKESVIEEITAPLNNISFGHLFM